MHDLTRTVLFVDADQEAEQALRSAAVRQRGWDLTFTAGGRAALAVLEEAPFDAVVTDLHVSDMGGPELLEAVHDQHPAAVRVLLSDESDFDDGVRATPVAHQSLVKPCPPEELLRVIERTCGLQSLIGPTRAQVIVSRVTSLPAIPDTFQRLNEALASPDSSLGEIGDIVEQDIALFAKVLTLVNSAYFALPRRIAGAREAVTLLGVQTLRSLVLSVEVFRTWSPPRGIAGFSVDELEVHSLEVARGAARIVPRFAGEAFTAGLLHDVGKLVLAAEEPERFEAMLAQAAEGDRPLHEVEREHLGVSHAEIGAYLVGLWGIPLTVVEAIARHHDDTQRAKTRLDVVGAVAFANASVHERERAAV